MGRSILHKYSNVRNLNSWQAGTVLFHTGLHALKGRLREIFYFLFPPPYRRVYI